MSCTNNRHREINLAAGEQDSDFYCLEGVVTVCGGCRKFIRGEIGSRYLNSMSLIEVNSLGKGVWKRSVRDEHREELIRGAAVARTIAV